MVECIPGQGVMIGIFNQDTVTCLMVPGLVIGEVIVIAGTYQDEPRKLVGGKIVVCLVIQDRVVA